MLNVMKNDQDLFAELLLVKPEKTNPTFKAFFDCVILKAQTVLPDGCTLFVHIFSLILMTQFRNT